MSSPVEPSIAETTRQLLKSRLRYFLFISKAEAGGDEEGKWRSLLLMEDAVLARSDADFYRVVAGSGALSGAEYYLALRGAVEDVYETFPTEQQRDAVRPLIEEWVGRCLLSIPTEA